MSNPAVPASMRASVLLPDRSLIVEDRAVPTPAPDEVLVAVSSVGVCGSDVHYYKEGRIGDFIVDSPLVLGHESGGTIVAVGSQVDPARIGHRVSIEPQHPASLSPEVLAGDYNLDPAMKFYATPPIDGAFQQYVTIQSAFAFDVPDSMSDEAAALIEPLSVGVAANQKGRVTVGSRVLVTGAGPIGIMMVQVARAYGAEEIIVSEVDEGRRDAALSFGATSVLDPRSADPGALGLNVDAFIDASGAAPAVVSGLKALRPAGVAVLVGMGADTIAMPVPVIQNRELVVTGVFRYANTWPTAISMVRTGKVDLDRMVTGHFDLDHVEDALNSATQSTTIKSIVHPN